MEPCKTIMLCWLQSIYYKETEGRRKDQKPPFKSSGDTFDISFWNSTEARRAEIPSAGGLASARSLAIIAGITNVLKFQIIAVKL